MMSTKSSTQSAPTASGAPAPQTPASFRRIFVPIDQHAPSESAAKLGVDLAKRLEASLVLMYLEITDRARRKILQIDAPGVEELDDEQLANLLQTLLRRSSTKAFDGAEHIDEDERAVSHSVADEIIDGATESKADLIIMGMLHHSATEKFLAGGVVDRVLNLAPCPVMIVS